ncbi:unnamed protein product [Lymnaea stagnalis]|uniref:Methyltransferase domain-containing protein n=1 Tax=Lymnaea stagnalis TaxID=6523 RepID=A0AAV2ILV5_LYMST
MGGGFFASRKLLVSGFVLVFGACVFVFAIVMQQGQIPQINFQLPSIITSDKAVQGLTDKAVQGLTDKAVQGLTDKAVQGLTDKAVQGLTEKATVGIKDIFDNSNAIKYLQSYAELFKGKDEDLQDADPNNPESIKTWWQAAAMIDWYINTPLRYKCKKKVAYGNWHVCQDPPYSVKPPCLVYSFGINFDFSFDDAMAKLGCEVHSFDPSMEWEDKKRGPNSTFHNLGLSNKNTDGFNPRKDMYVTKKQIWKMRTIKSVMKELGHEQRTIDVLKIDIEGYEWDVIDNMMETDVFKYIRQFMLEFHLFRDWPVKEDYVYLYKIYTRLREMGFREFSIGPHPKTLKANSFNNQGDSEYVNAFFNRTNSYS